MPDILDLPEPQRSKALRDRGMTEEQFRRYMADFKAATEADPQERDPLHYEDEANPSVEVTEPPGEG